MYLSKLNPVESKKFLELVYKIANADVNYGGEEIHLLKKFKGELDLDIIPSGSTVDELINYFATTDASVQKIVYFEATGMVFADEKTTEKEQAILDKMAKEFVLTEEEAAQIAAVSKQLEEAYKAVNAVMK